MELGPGMKAGIYVEIESGLELYKIAEVVNTSSKARDFEISVTLK